MTNGIKKFNVAKKLKVKFSLRKKKPLEKIQKIGLIVYAKGVEVEALTIKLLSAFNLPAKNLITLVANGNQQKESENMILLSEKDLSWRAEFKTEHKIKSFLAADLDLVINYFTSNHQALLLASASAEAKLKAGLPHKEPRLNDLEIVVKKEEVAIFILELKKYINTITG